MLWPRGVISPAQPIYAGGDSERDLATQDRIYADQCERFLDHWYGGRARRERLKDALVRRSGTVIDPREGGDDDEDVARVILSEDGTAIREESTELATISYVRKICTELGVLYASDDLERVYLTPADEVDEGTKAILDSYHGPSRGALTARLHLVDGWLPGLRTVGLLVDYCQDTREIIYTVIPPHWLAVLPRPDHHLSLRLAYAVAYVEPEAQDADGKPIPGAVYTAYVRPALPSDPTDAPTRGPWEQTGRLVRYRTGGVGIGPWPLPDSSTPQGRAAIIEDPEEVDGLAEYVNPIATTYRGWDPPRSLVWQPIVLHHAEPPVESLRLPVADHLCRMGEEIDCGISDALSTAALQSYGQPVYKGAGTPPEVVGRRHTVHVLDPAGDYGFASPGSQPQAHLEAIRTVAQMGASCEDLPYDLLADHPASIETGPAIRLRRHALIQARARRTVDATKPETRRFELERVLHNALGTAPRIPDTTRLVVHWGELAVPTIWGERLQEMQLERALGLSSLVDQIMERHGVAREEAERRAAESSGEDSEVVSLDAVGVPGAPADAGAPPEVAANAVPPDTALNGAQVDALLRIVQETAAGRLPRDAALEMIVTAFPVGRDAANRILGSVGRGFKMEEEAQLLPGPGGPDRPQATADSAEPRGDT